jgi:hypothetical protein
MRTVAAVGATAILILVTEAWLRAAGAEDAIKPGKWELSWTVVGPKMQKPPEGMITSVCLPETKLKPPHVHRRFDTTSQGNLGKGSCDMDTTTDATTATRSELANCAWSTGATSRVEVVLHFHGDTLDGTTTNRFSLPNKPPTEHLSVVKGRYVGPCDAK